MQFGMPTLIEIKSLEACAALCRELGLAFVELNMNLPEYQADKLDDIKLRVPYYATAPRNISSQRVAHRAGFIPAWACVYKGRFDDVLTESTCG